MPRTLSLVLLLNADTRPVPSPSAESPLASSGNAAEENDAPTEGGLLLSIEESDE